MDKGMVISVLDAVNGIITDANDDGTRCELPEDNDEFAELVLNYLKGDAL